MIYVALLRGINVGGNNKVEMKKLKTVFESVGMKSVETYINSGNIIFRSSLNSKRELSKILEQAIAKHFQLDIKVLIRSFKDFEALMEVLPDFWKNDKEMKSDVMFLWEAVDNIAVLNELPNKSKIDTVKYIPGAILWNVSRENQPKSGMVKLVGTRLYRQMTIRNVNTVRKIFMIMQKIDIGSSST